MGDSIENTIQNEITQAEIFEIVFSALENDAQKTADLIADLFDRLGESDYAVRVREARSDSDRLLDVFAAIEKDATQRRARL